MATPTNPGPIEFSAELRPSDRSSGTYIEFPYDTAALYGTSGRVKVRVTLDGKAVYRGSLVKYSGIMMIGIPKAVREEAGASAGDTVDVVVEVDAEERQVTVPPELAEALARDPRAAAGWDALSYSRRRELAGAVAEAKRAETKERRVEAALAAAQDRAKG